MFTLSIISKHPNFLNQELRKYNLEGTDTIGVWGNEAYAIRLKNGTGQKIEVRFSIDGTDILSGKPANTNSGGRTFIVQPYDTTELQAWPETNSSGASFLFTDAGKSVSSNTHGNTESMGIIAAAIFVEGAPPPPKFVRTNGLNGLWEGPQTFGSPMRGGGATRGGIRGQSLEASFKGGAGTGAGETVAQHIGTAAGLIQPRFDQVLRVRYMWSDDLQNALGFASQSNSGGSGFPGDRTFQGINLGSTPRQSSASPTSVFSRMV